MNNYYRATAYVWLAFTLFSAGYAVWQYRETGAQAWWYFVAAGLALFLFLKRYRTLKISRRQEKTGAGTEN